MSDIQLFAVAPAGPKALPVPAGATTVHDIFVGLDLALGVYSTLCTFSHNKFLRLADHLDRLANSMILLGWHYELDRPALRQALHQVCTAFPMPESRARLDVLAAPAATLGSDSRLLIALEPFVPLPEAVYQAGVRAGLTSRLRRTKPLVKDANFVAQRRPYLLEDEQAYEQLLLDDRGYILEGITSNFYAVRDGELRTAGQGVLEGTARNIVLEQARALGILVRFSPVHLDELSQIEEAAMSSASRAIIPIVNIAGQEIGSGRPGPVVERLLGAYRRYVAQEIRFAVDDPSLSLNSAARDN